MLTEIRHHISTPSSAKSLITSTKMLQHLTRTLPSTVFRTSVTPIRQTAPILRRFYHEKVLDHYNRPRNVGSLPKGDIDVGTGLYFSSPFESMY